MQLDLLSYQLTADEVGSEPQPSKPDPARVNATAIHAQHVKAAVYLRLISKFMSGTKTPLAVRQHEIQRLFEMREAALAEARRLSDGQP